VIRAISVKARGRLRDPIKRGDEGSCWALEGSDQPAPLWRTRRGDVGRWVESRSDSISRPARPAGGRGRCAGGGGTRVRAPCNVPGSNAVRGSPTTARRPAAQTLELVEVQASAGGPRRALASGSRRERISKFSGNVLSVGGEHDRATSERRWRSPLAGLSVTSRLAHRRRAEAKRDASLSSPWARRVRRPALGLDHAAQIGAPLIASAAATASGARGR